MTSPTATSSRPSLHVAARLPPAISFSSAEEPHIEVRLTLEHSQPIILDWKRSHLNPQWFQSALSIKEINYGQREHVPYMDICYRSGNRPLPPPLTLENRDKFLGLSPAETRILQIPFRPYQMPAHARVYEKPEDKYKDLFPFGMQYLRIGAEYEMGFESKDEWYMLGELDILLGRNESVAWTYAKDWAEVIVGEKCRFCVEA